MRRIESGWKRICLLVYTRIKRIYLNNVGYKLISFYSISSINSQLNLNVVGLIFQFMHSREVRHCFIKRGGIGNTGAEVTINLGEVKIKLATNMV